MGLCKCPKKKVTNQFCFEHRVNVCEHCIVADHTKCVVQSYLQWLNDSEYDPICSLCKEALHSKDCTRLVCYDVFHSSCLEDWGSSHPPHTAPAGFKCPVCQAPVIPAPQHASPVALALKEKLATWSWAKKLMGSSDVQDGWKSINGPSQSQAAGSNGTVAGPSTAPTIATHSYTGSTASQQQSHATSTSGSHVASGGVNSPNDGVFSNAPTTNTYNVAAGAANSSSYRDRTHSLKVQEDSVENDTDNDKYKRRSAVTWFKRWWRSYQPLGSGASSRSLGRRRMLALLVVIFIATILLLMSSGRSNEVDDGRHLDPAFDPLNNPNIHVQESI